MSYGTVQAEKMTTESGYSLGAGNASSFKNRLINGAMTIDQRNAGASVTQNATGIYTLDRWSAYGLITSKFTVQQNSGSVTPPVGFKNYLGCTSLSAYALTSSDIYIVQQNIEGYNVADLGWGTANAKTVTLSFWVYSSLTGTFGGSITGGNSRNYPFSYSVSVANTWTQISITIAGDTSGTWGSTNGTGIIVNWSLGTGSSYSNTGGAWTASSSYSVPSAVSVVSTNGATFYITGTQFEVGTVATSFDFRSIGTELALCQRYFETSYPLGTAVGTITGNGIRMASAAAAFVGGTSTRAMMFNATFAVQKRVLPNTITFYDPAASNASGKISTYSGNVQYTVSSSAGAGATNLGSFITTTTGTQTEMYQFHFTADSEL